MTNLNYFWNKKVFLSFVASLLIISIHNSTIFQYNLVPTNPASILHNFFAYNIGSFAVPTFFFLSGMTLFRNYSTKKFKTKLKSRIKSIFIPYIIWNIIGLLLCIIYTYTPLNEYSTSRELFTPTLSNIFEGIFLFKYNYHFWFMCELFLLILLTPFLNLCIHKKVFATIIGLLLLILPQFIASPSFFNLNFVIFYYLGCYVGKHHFSDFSAISTSKAQCISLVVLICIIVTQQLNIYSIITLPFILSQTLTIISLFSLWFTFDLILPRIKKLPSFVNEFFPVYAMHPFIIPVIIKIFYLITPKTPYMALLNEVLSYTITVFLTFLIATLIHHKTPKLYQFIFGIKTHTKDTNVSTII